MAQRLLIVSGNFSPELTGIGKYVSEMTAHFAAGGVEVRVVTTPPYYPAWRVQPGYRAWGYRRELLCGARVYRCPLFVPQRPGALARILHHLSFALSSLPVLLWQALWWRPQVVFAVAPPLLSSPGALWASALCGARSWLHVQDFEVDAAFELGILRARRMRRAIVAFERWLKRRFTRVTSISGRMVQRLHAKGIEPARTGLLCNWVEISDPQAEPDARSVLRELDLEPGRDLLLYSGNMGEKQGLEVLIDAAREHAATHSSLFLLCGEGAARARLVQQAQGMSNIRFLPLQPIRRFSALLSAATIHLLPQRAGAEDLVMPSKLAGMMASGRPVIATARPDSEIAAALADTGLLVPPGDSRALAGAIAELLADAPRRNRLGEAARGRALARWERNAVMQHALHALQELIAQK